MKTQTKMKRIDMVLDTIDTQEEWDKVVKNVIAHFQAWHKINVQQTLTVGDRVAFESTHKKYAGRHIGILIGKKVKTCTISVTIGYPKGNWKVPCDRLQKATKNDITLLALEKMQEVK